MPAAIRSKLCSSVSAWLGVFASETRFFPRSGRVDTALWMHYLDANKTAREEDRRQLHKYVKRNIE